MGMLLKLARKSYSVKVQKIIKEVGALGLEEVSGNPKIY